MAICSTPINPAVRAASAGRPSYDWDTLVWSTKNVLEARFSPIDTCPPTSGGHGLIWGPLDRCDLVKIVDSFSVFGTAGDSPKSQDGQAARSAEWPGERQAFVPAAAASITKFEAATLPETTPLRGPGLRPPSGEGTADGVLLPIPHESNEDGHPSPSSLGFP